MRACWCAPRPVRREYRRKLVVVGLAVLATVGLWVLIKAGYAWIERDAMLEWIAERDRTSMLTIRALQAAGFHAIRAPNGGAAARHPSSSGRLSVVLTGLLNIGSGTG